MLEESFVFILCHFLFVPVPNGLQLVYHLSVQFDRVTDKQRVLLQDLLHLRLPRELSALRFHFQHYLSTSIKANVVDIRHFVLSAAITDPPDAALVLAPLREHFNTVRHNECAVEAHTELSNDRIQCPLVSAALLRSHLLQEFLRPALSNCAQVIYNLLFAHTDA